MAEAPTTPPRSRTTFSTEPVSLGSLLDRLCAEAVVDPWIHDGLRQIGISYQIAVAVREDPLVVNAALPLRLVDGLVFNTILGQEEEMDAESSAWLVDTVHAEGLAYEQELADAQATAANDEATAANDEAAAANEAEATAATDEQDR